MFNKKPLAIFTAIFASNLAIAEENVFTLDQVQVSATRSQQTIQDTAASVKVISDKEIEDNMTNTISQLFLYTPGVDIQTNSRQGAQSINIRGIEGNRIKILVDGVSQANQFENNYSFINSGRVDVDIDMLKSVEVVKGAASSLQGSDAIGGIVAFKSKDPSDFLTDGKNYGGHVKVNYSSSDQSFTESVALANRVEKMETLIAYTRQDSQEVDNFGNPDEQDSAANNILLKLQYQLNQANRIEFTGEYVKNTIDSKFNDNAYHDYTGQDKSERYRVGVKHILQADSKIADNVTWQVDYMSKKQNGLTDRTYLSDENKQRKDYVYTDKSVQADIQLDKSLMAGDIEHFLVYGVSATSKKINNTNDEYNSTRPDQKIFYMPKATELRYGLFVQDEIVINDLILTPGIRFDSFQTDPGNNFPDGSNYDQHLYKKHSDSAFTGRLGALYALNSENKIFTQISQGFRAPDFQELFYSFGNPMHGYVSVPNPDLKAEKSISYELGWRHENKSSATEVALFYSDYKDFIDYQRTGTENGLSEYQYINVNDATIKGVELSNRLDWHQLIGAPQGISTNIAATYTEGKGSHGEPLNSVNPWNSVAGLNYDSPLGNWGGSIKVVYTAKKKKSDVTADQDFTGEDLPTFTPSSSTVIDLTTYYVPVENLMLRAGIFNLTNKEYYRWNDVRGLEEEDKFYTQARRNFAITAKYQF